MAEEQKNTSARTIDPAHSAQNATDRTVIQDIQFHHAGKAIPRTTIFLTPDVTRQQVEPLARLFTDQGMQVRPAVVERKWALKITSPVASEQSLFAALKSGGFIDDKFETAWSARQKQQELAEAPKGAFGKLVAKVGGTKEQRLQRAGIAYAIGDWLGMGIGAVNKNWGDFGFGFFAHLGTIPWIFYSRDKNGMTHSEHIIDDMRDDFTRNKKAQYAAGVNLPPPKNAKEGFDRFMTKNAYFLGCFWNLISGPALAKAGIDQGNPFKFTSGALVTAGWTIGSFVTQEGTKGTVNWGKVADSLGIGTEYRQLKRDAIARGEAVPEKHHSILTAPFRGIGNNIHQHARRWAGMLPLIHNFNTLFFTTSKDIFWGQAEKNDIARRYGVPDVHEGKAEGMRRRFYEALGKEPPDAHGEWTYRLGKGKKSEIKSAPLIDPDRFNLKDGRHWTELKRGFLWWDGELDKHIATIMDDAEHGRSGISMHDAKIFQHDALRYDEKRRLKVSGWLTAVMVGSYMVANSLISSVKSDADKKVNLDEIYSDAALLLLKQQEPVYQIALLADMTQYLGDRPELQKQKLSQVQIAEGILKAAVAIAQGPLLSGEERAQAEGVVQNLGRYGQTLSQEKEKSAKSWTATQATPAASWTQAQEVAAAPPVTPSR